MRIFAGSFSSVGATKKTSPSNRSWPTIVSRARLVDADDAAFGPSAGLAKRDLDLDLVAVHGGAGERGRDEDVAVESFDLSLRERRTRIHRDAAMIVPSTRFRACASYRFPLCCVELAFLDELSRGCP